MKLRALLVVGLLAGIFAPRWLPQPLHASCCCPQGMLGACSRTDDDCSLKRCMPDGAAAIALSAPKILLPPAPALPAPAEGALPAPFEAVAATAPPNDPSDPPPRVQATPRFHAIRSEPHDSSGRRTRSSGLAMWRSPMVFLRRTALIRAAVAVAAVLSLPRGVFASCGSATCPMDPQSLNLPLPRQFTLDVSFQYIDQDQVRIGRRRGEVGEIPSSHDEVETVNRAVGLLANYAPSDRLVLSAVVPFVSRFHEHIEDTHHDSSISKTEVRHNVRETWHFDDLGDAAVIARYRLGTKFWATGGVELPTGARRPANDEGEVAEPTLAPGSGSTDLFGGLVYQTQIGVPSLSRGPLGSASVMPFFVGATYRRNGRGTEDYRQGDELLVNAGVNYPLFARLQVLAQVNADFRGRDDVGNTEEDPSHTGRTSVFLSPGVRVGLPGGVAAYWLVQIPVYQRVNGIQLTAGYNLVGGIQARF